jgi:hypothetical protein
MPIAGDLSDESLASELDIAVGLTYTGICKNDVD